MRILDFYDGFNSSTQPDIEFLDAFENSALADMPAHTIKGNNSNAPSSPADLTVAQVQVLLAIPSTSSPLPIAAGGTGMGTNAAAFNALSPSTTKGDLIGYGTLNQRIPVGADGTVLTADSTKPTGVDWKASTTASTTVVVKARKNTGNQTLMGDFQDVASWDLVTVDSANAFNATTGVFTCPSAGTYLVIGSIQLATSGLVAIQINKNNLKGVEAEAGVDVVGNNGLISTAHASTIVKCNAGDTLKLSSYQNTAASVAYVSQHRYNTLSIVRVGD